MKTLVGAVALGALLLSGCGAEAEPKFEADPSSSPTSASPTPDEPEPWEEKTPDGAIAFAEHWTATFSEAFQTGDTEEFLSLGTTTCGTCKDLADLIREIYDQGGSIAGSNWRFTKASWSATDETENEVTVSGLMRIPAQKFSRPGEKVNRTEPSTNRFTFVLRFMDRRWTATRVTRAA